MNLEPLELRETVCACVKKDCVRMCGGRLCACVKKDCVRKCGAVILRYLLSSGTFVAKLLSCDRKLHFLSEASTSKSERDFSHP